MGDAFHCHYCKRAQDNCICPEPPLSRLQRYAPIGYGSSLMAKRHDGEYVKLADVQALPAPSRAPEGWQPLETAPKDGTLVLLQVDCEVRVAKWGKSLKTWIADRDNDRILGTVYVGGWQPLPPASPRPPTEPQKETP